MSQFFQGVTAGSLPPSVPLAFTEDTGTAVPVANNLNILGGVGIDTSGSGSTVTISLENSSTGTETTVGAVTADVLTVNLTIAVGGAGTISIESRVAGFNASTPASAGYLLYGTARTDGVTATIVSTPDQIINEDSALAAADCTFVASGNNVIVRATGVAGLTIVWRATSNYTVAP